MLLRWLKIKITSRVKKFRETRICPRKTRITTELLVRNNFLMVLERTMLRIILVRIYEMIRLCHRISKLFHLYQIFRNRQIPILFQRQLQDNCLPSMSMRYFIQDFLLLKIKLSISFLVHIKNHRQL